MAKNRGLSFYSKKKRINSSSIREAFSWVFGIVTSIFIGVVLTMFLGKTIRMTGGSMEPTIAANQMVYVDRFVYLLSKPQKGHVIVFLPNGNEKAQYYVKRVIAVPGDHLVVKDGVLYVNGLESKYVTEKIEDAGIAENDITLANGQYFVIGDNPDEGEDSRSANLGPVNIEDIIGKVWFRAKSSDAARGRVK